jgi:hypothetical protein
VSVSVSVLWIIQYSALAPNQISDTIAVHSSHASVYVCVCVVCVLCVCVCVRVCVCLSVSLLLSICASVGMFILVPTCGQIHT